MKGEPETELSHTDRGERELERETGVLREHLLSHVRERRRQKEKEGQQGQRKACSYYTHKPFHHSGSAQINRTQGRVGRGAHLQLVIHYLQTVHIENGQVLWGPGEEPGMNQSGDVMIIENEPERRARRQTQ